MAVSGLRRRFGAGSHISTGVAAVFLGALGIFAAAAAQKADISDLTSQSIEISAKPFDFDTAEPARRKFGRLEWRGGYVLSSRSPFFGGYSALALTTDGERLLSISDSGSWLTAHLRTRDGQLTGIDDARIGPLTQKDGRPIQRKRDRDAESVVALQPGESLDGHYDTGCEAKYRIDEYVFKGGEIRGPVGGVRIPPQLKRMSQNEGLEGMTILRGGPYAGALVAFSERKLTAEGNHTGAMIKDG